MGADTDEGFLHRDRDLPGDGDLRTGVVAPGEVAAEGGDERAVDALGARGGLRRYGSLRRRLCDGAGYEGPARDGAQRDGAALIIVRRENLARRYSCCSAMLMRAASFSGTPMRGVSMAEKVLLATIAPQATG